MRIKQIIAAVLAAACVSACFATTVSAKNIPTYSIVNSVSPLYDISHNAYSRLTVVGTKADCASQADGENVVKIAAEQTLQKYSGWLWFWDDVNGASWTKSENKSSVSLLNTKSGLDSGTYRLKSVFTLTDKNGKTETITAYSDEKQVQ